MSGRAIDAHDLASAELAGTEFATELLTDPVVDLRDGINPALRTSRATRAAAAGCPCGCGDAELIGRARRGDDAAIAELLGRYRAMAAAKARSYFLIGADRDDVVQEAMIGVFQAIRDFDVDRGVSFRTFAEVCVTRQIITAVRAANRLKHSPLSASMSLDRPAKDDEGLTLAELLPAARSADPEAAVLAGEEVRALQRHIDEVLTDLERQVLRHHMEGKSYDQIADMLQRHVKAIDNALQRIRRKLKDQLVA